MQPPLIFPVRVYRPFFITEKHKMIALKGFSVELIPKDIWVGTGKAQIKLLPSINRSKNEDLDSSRPIHGQSLLGGI